MNGTENEIAPEGFAPHVEDFTASPIGERTLRGGRDHLVTVSFARPVAPPALAEALARIGFARTVIDEEIRGLIPAGQTISFVGSAEAEKTIRLFDTDLVRWTEARELVAEPFADLHYELRPFELETDRDYELVFLTRMKSQPTRERVVEVLRAMGPETAEKVGHGFEIRHLLSLRRDMRIPAHPGTSATLWFALARWHGPHSHVNMDDPVYFEQVVALS